MNRTKPLKRTGFRSKVAHREPKRMDGYEVKPRAPAAGSGLVSCVLGANFRPGAIVPYQPTTPTRKTRPTPIESAHMGRVKRLRCVLCARLGLTQTSITDVHHLREEQGGAQRASHWLTAALCHHGCHQGPHGIHGDRALLRQAKCTELDLLAWTLEALARGEDNHQEAA